MIQKYIVKLHTIYQIDIYYNTTRHAFLGI